MLIAPARVRTSSVLAVPGTPAPVLVSELFGKEVDVLFFKDSFTGKIAGLDNGDPTDHESFQGDRHKVFHGLGLVVVQTTRTAGRITLHAEADGLAPAETAVESAAAEK